MMMSSLFGSVTLEITSADLMSLLIRMNNSGIILNKLESKDALTVTCEATRKDIPLIRKLAATSGSTVKIRNRRGFHWFIKKILARPLLIISICLQFLLLLWLPTRVLFVRVEGNEAIHTQEILEQAHNCGIVFGASRRAVRSEKMKNSLLSAIPALQWAGINTSGCTAVISVKERSAPQQNHSDRGIGSIVAAKDGIILSCTALRGDIKCKIGQAVQKGDVLISGYEDLGLCMKAVSANGEIYAQTNQEIRVISPVDYQKKGMIAGTEKKYGILLGKKRIFFNKGSGISGVGCDKIYAEYYVTLPGGYRLPVALIVTVTTARETAAYADVQLGQNTAKETARSYLLSNMISGQILLEKTRMEQHGNVCALSGWYVCSEMIGRVQHEEIHEFYGKSN